MFAEDVYQSVKTPLTGSSTNNIALLDSQDPGKGLFIDYAKSSTGEHFILNLVCGDSFSNIGATRDSVNKISVVT